ncbi:MAG: biotin carboxylase N-terminal domain-containing protein [Candidatus Sericytochromatia bacterium]
MIKKILIANRGEIADRVIRTCKKLFIDTIAIFSEEDKFLPYIKNADMSIYLGKGNLSDTYLNQDKIITLALENNCDAIHAGYGFLAENYRFVQKCIDNNIIFIGPNSEAIKLASDKNKAKELVKKLDIPIIEGFNITSLNLNEIKTILEKETFPILLKASFGGGGKGIKIVNSIMELEETLISSKNEALYSFGNDEIIFEKYLYNAKHIEIQILGDNYGNYLHLFERDCSIQRRYQKIIEESPCISISQELKNKLYDSALKIAKELNYNNLGTIEFLVDGNNFYFIEINPRLQVEHTVTEEVTGLDLVELQIDIANNKKINLTQTDIKLKGHAIQSRIYSEKPENNFLPSSGEILYLDLKSNKNYFPRIESNLFLGQKININYDPMIAKVISYGDNREEAIIKNKKYLENFILLGIETNLSFLYSILENKEFCSSEHNTSFVENNIKSILEEKNTYIKEFLCASLVKIYLERKKSKKVFRSIESGWRNLFFKPQFEILELNENIYTLEYLVKENKFEINIINENKNDIFEVEILEEKNEYFSLLINDKVFNFKIILDKNSIYLNSKHLNKKITLMSKFLENKEEEKDNIYFSHMPCEIKKIHIKEKDIIKEGDKLITVSSMKMEMTFYANKDGQVKNILVSEGDFITEKYKLLEFL